MSAALAPQRIIDYARLLDIVRGEYLEMPGLRLSKRQAQRLWAVDTATCDALFNSLERVNFLRRTRDGEYLLANRGCSLTGCPGSAAAKELA